MSRLVACVVDWNNFAYGAGGEEVGAVFVGIVLYSGAVERFLGQAMDTTHNPRGWE
jgi:hypothetical protein